MTAAHQLLRRVIEASGLSARRFATLVAWRDERTIRRWLAGEPIPAIVQQQLARWAALDAAHLRRIVRALAD